MSWNISNLVIEQLDDTFSVVKNIENNKYVKLGKREIRFLLEQLCTGNSISEEQIEVYLCAEELMEEEKKFLLDKFVKWEFIEPREGLSGFLPKNEKKDWSKIKLFQFNPSKLLARIPYWVTCLFFGWRINRDFNVCVT